MTASATTSCGKTPRDNLPRDRQSLNDATTLRDDAATARINVYGTATSETTSIKNDTMGKGKVTDSVNISDRVDEQQGALSSNKNCKRVKLRKSKKTHLKQRSNADGHKKGKA